ncbi:MAG: hypothetical protein WDM80_10470 [Limisphaerales bacterium]
MKRKTQLVNKTLVVFWTLLSIVLCDFSTQGQGVQHLLEPQPGGWPGLPVMNGILKVTNGVSLMWTGPSGYYQLQKKSSLTGSSWQNVGARTLNWQATVAVVPGNAFFRVSGPSPHFIGSQACTECHGNIQSTVLRTVHATAFTDADFVSAGGQNNPSCLSCHTVATSCRPDLSASP